MNIVTLQQPTRIVFGPGCAAACVDELKARGLRRVFLVTSPPVVALAEPLVALLREAGVAVTLYAAIDRESDIAMFTAALEAARLAAPDAVLGLGGGSALDVAKLIAALYDGRQDVRAVFGIGLLAGRALYLACLPTTAGTGSEVSPNAILLDESAHLKKGVVSPHLLPDAAFVDPLLTVTVPPDVTAATGLDALTHCIEAYANRFAHPIVDVYARQGIGLITGHLLRAVRDGHDLPAREAVALGSLYGGLCLAPVNTAAVHALAYPLGGQFHIAHGVANAVLLPHVLRFNLPACVERYADLAEFMGLAAAGSLEETAAAGLERLSQLAREVGLPPGLGALGIPREAIPGLALAAMQVTRLLKNNPRNVTAADAESIYEAAF